MLRDDCNSLIALKRIYSASCCKYLHLRACYLHGHLLLGSDLLTICLFFKKKNLKPTGLCLVFIFCFTVHLAKATSSHGLCDVEVSKIHPLFFYCLLSVLSTGVFLVYLRGSFVFSLLIVYLAVFLHSLDLYKYFTPLGNLLLGF